MTNIIRVAYDWMGSKVYDTHANWWLVAFFFIEAFIFPIPVDPLLILFCVERSRHSFRYAAISTTASVCGGVIGYALGFYIWDLIGSFVLTYLIAPETFEGLRHKYTVYEAWAVLIAGFTPVPYKAVTLSAGFFRLPFAPFIGYSLIARGARFFLLAGIIRIWGVQIKNFIDRYFNWLVGLFAILVVCSTFILR